MFLVFNKSKIYSYVIALCTVVVLFVAAAKLNDVVSPNTNVIETSTNLVNMNTQADSFNNSNMKSENVINRDVNEVNTNNN